MIRIYLIFSFINFTGDTIACSIYPIHNDTPTLFNEKYCVRYFYFHILLLIFSLLSTAGTTIRGKISEIDPVNLIVAK